MPRIKSVISRRAVLLLLPFLACNVALPPSIISMLAATAFAAPETPGSSSGPTKQELQQLVSPIALYPDTLVGMILAASTYPTQIVMADRFLQDNPSLKGKALSQAVDQQSWDPSVKALTQFPSVLDNMNKNLSWTSALGDAYYNDPQAVMAEIQYLRGMAKQAGSLKTTPQQTVTQQGQTIIIQPANPQVVYVPQYNPTAVYGAPVAAYPGYSGTDMLLAGLIGFGAGMLVGTAISGSSGWGCNWGGHAVVYNNQTYVSNTNNFYNHNWNNKNWNNSHPSNNYNNWSNQLKNQNWQQARNDFNRNNPNFQQNHSNWNQQHSQWNHQNQPGKYNSSYNARHNNYSRNGYSGRNDNYRGYDNSNRSRWGNGGAFGGYRSGGSAFADSARGRWSSGGFGGGRSRR